MEDKKRKVDRHQVMSKVIQLRVTLQKRTVIIQHNSAPVEWLARPLPSQGQDVPMAEWTGNPKNW